MSTLIASASLQQAMDTLTAQWYNAVVKGCGLDQTTFQLAQGSQPVGATSEILWNIFDSVPPFAVTHLFNQSQSNNFSSDYGAVVNNLVPPNETTFLTAMGDFFAPWQRYLDTGPTIPLPGGTQGLIQLLQDWSLVHMPPNQAQKAVTAYQEIAQSAVSVAVAMWSAAGYPAKQLAYNNTIANLIDSIPKSAGKSFTMDSATESSNVEQTWAKGEVGGFYDFFAGEASGQYDDLASSLTESTLNISVTFDHVLSFAAGPLAKVSADPILSQFQPWYNSAALSLAFTHPNDNTVWNNNPPSWDDAFGPEGDLQRRATSLVVVDGVKIKTKSTAGFSSDNQERIKAAMSFGFFPFFEAEGSGGWSHEVSFDDQGLMTMDSTCPPGNPNILGVNVSPIKDVIALDA